MMMKILSIFIFLLISVSGNSQKRDFLTRSGMVRRMEVYDSAAIAGAIATKQPAGDYSAVGHVHAYNSLTGLPSLFDGDYNSLSNKPSLFSGSYIDLSNKPIIPTNTNELTNGTGFLVGADIAGKLNISDTAAMLTAYQNAINGRATAAQNALKVNISDTSGMLTNYRNGLNSLISTKVNISDTSGMLTAYRNALNLGVSTKLNKTDTAAMLLSYQNAINAGVAATNNKSTVYFGTDAGANDSYVITASPVPGSYTTGMMVVFKANTSNTTGCSINVNGLGAKTIVKRVNTTPATGDILALMFCWLVYDGTNFVLLNPVVN